MKKPRSHAHATSPPTHFAGPAGICICGHSGDGLNTEHDDTAEPLGRTMFGQGRCNVVGCYCRRFLCKRRTKAYQAYVDACAKAATPSV